jgi:hypothetical protein
MRDSELLSHGRVTMIRGDGMTGHDSISVIGLIFVAVDLFRTDKP